MFLIGLLAVGSSALAERAAAGSSDPIDTASSEESTAAMSPKQIAEQAALPIFQAKTAAADAFVRYQDGEISADEFAKVDDAVFSQLGIANPFASGSSMQAPAAVASSPVQLGVSQAGQLQSNWCGPAAAYEIMSYYGLWNSAYDGSSLSQSQLSTSTYTGAGATGGTDFSTSAMPRALNRWRFGGAIGYVQVTPSSSADLFNRANYDITHNWPVADDMTEVYNGPHYNGHPNRTSDIKHWTVITGVWAGSGYGDLLYFADSSTTVFPGASAFFWYGIADAYARMTSPYTRGIVW